MVVKVSPYIAERMKRSKDDFEVDTFRSGGPGGQNQNKVNSGVRIKDKITGLAVESREERSQLQNKKIAWHRLIEKIIVYYRQEESKQKVVELSNQKTIRTYKEGKVIDHRTGKVYPLNKIMNGELEQVVKDCTEILGIQIEELLG